jgi:hypothetical protein
MSIDCKLLDSFSGRIDKAQSIFLSGLKLKFAYTGIWSACQCCIAARIAHLAIDLRRIKVRP